MTKIIKVMTVLVYLIYFTSRYISKYSVFTLKRVKQLMENNKLHTCQVVLFIDLHLCWIGSADAYIITTINFEDIRLFLSRWFAESQTHVIQFFSSSYTTYLLGRIEWRDLNILKGKNVIYAVSDCLNTCALFD